MGNVSLKTAENYGPWQLCARAQHDTPPKGGAMKNLRPRDEFLCSRKRGDTGKWSLFEKNLDLYKRPELECTFMKWARLTVVFTPKRAQP
jgi:hypothetical protein